MRTPSALAAAVFALVALVPACPRSTQLGAPCEQAGDELCEGTQKLRCDGRQYQLLALCHGECVTGDGVTHEQGEIASSQTWLCTESPHLVRGVIDVVGGAVLTIEPGTIVRLEPSSEVDIADDARVVIDATPGAPVLFTSNNELAGGFATAATGGLNVFATNDEPSIIRNLIVERGQNGLGVFGLSATATPPVVESSTFRDNTLFGVLISCDAVDSPVPAFEESGNLFFGNGEGDVSTCAD